jgi:hypothetical protein
VDDPLRCHEDFNSFGQSGALDKPIFSQGNEIFDGLPYVHGSLPEVGTSISFGICSFCCPCVNEKPDHVFLSSCHRTCCCIHPHALAAGNGQKCRIDNLLHV